MSRLHLQNYNTGLPLCKPFCPKGALESCTTVCLQTVAAPQISETPLLLWGQDILPCDSLFHLFDHAHDVGRVHRTVAVHVGARRIARFIGNNQDIHGIEAVFVFNGTLADAVSF